MNLPGRWALPTLPQGSEIFLSERLISFPQTAPSSTSGTRSKVKGEAHVLLLTLLGCRCYFCQCCCHYCYLLSLFLLLFCHSSSQGRVARQTQGLALGSADRFSVLGHVRIFELAFGFGMILGPSSLVSIGSRSSIIMITSPGCWRCSLFIGG